MILAGPYYPQSDGSKIFDLIKVLNLENHIHYIGKIDFDDLVGIYQAASLLIMPSIHEGFGLPVLEAMQNSLPVIASRAASLPEVVGSAGVLVDDYLNPNSWAKEISRLLRDDDLRNDLLKKGKEQSQKFSWKLSAQKTINIYQQIVSKKT